jgi:hypothetical protein
MSQRPFPLAQLSAILFLCGTLQSTSVGQVRNLLSGTFPPDAVRSVLLSAPSWHPFPRATERDAWNKIPEPLRQTYVRKGEAALTYAWPSLPASLYLEFARNGNRTNFQRPYYERRDKLVDLVLAECMEGKGRFLDQILNGVWLLCEETSWVIPAHIGAQRAGSGLPDKAEPVVDLFSAETGSLLSWTYYLLGDQLDKVSPLVSGRIKSELTTRIITPCRERNDFWWMWLSETDSVSHHVNNWTPWICSNWLATLLVMENNDELRQKDVSKILKVLDQFLNSYPDDGGCDEGPSYWGRAGGSLFECLELLETASGGKIDLSPNPLVKEIGRYLCKAHISGSYYINFSDAPAKVTIQPDLVLRYGLKIKDPELAGLGAYAAAEQKIMENGVSGGLARQLQFLFSLDALRGQQAKEPFFRDVWLPQSQFMVSRERRNSADGFYLASQALHNDKSHNHNDVGNFILYVDGSPCIIDVGPEAYTAKTFSNRRYEIWTMQSAYHNLPTINGMMQMNGREYAARNVKYRATDESVRFSFDIAGAYPSAAGIKKWSRQIAMDRNGGTVIVGDEYSLAAPPQEVRFSLMTPCEVQQTKPGRLVLRVKSGAAGQPPVDVEVRFDADKVKAQVETIPLTDDGLKRVWGDSLRRIQLTVKNQDQDGKVAVMFSRLPR